MKAYNPKRRSRSPMVERIDKGGLHHHPSTPPAMKYVSGVSRSYNAKYLFLSAALLSLAAVIAWIGFSFVVSK